MAKVALLVGVSEYQPGLAPLPGATHDIDAMQQVLQDQTMGGFDRVQCLENPNPMVFQEAVETVFAGRKKDDLVLFFFSGHGIKDDSGRLYFATPRTRKSDKGALVRSTAVPASFLHDIMSSSRCKRQVVLLDCCFSGAFAEGMQAKDDGAVDLQAALGGEGRAVLTSSSSTQYSFEQAGETLSIYTRFIVEGIQTGAADTDQNGVISIDELHEYASSKVQDVAPAMKPKIYAVEEGFKIHLAQAPVDDPALRYRREVEHFASRGEISPIGRSALDVLKTELDLSARQATHIETEVLKPYQEYQQRLRQCDQAVEVATERKKPITAITRRELNRYQEVLGLEDKDIAAIESRYQPPTQAQSIAVGAQTRDAAQTAQKPSGGAVALAKAPPEPITAAPAPASNGWLGKLSMVGVGIVISAAALVALLLIPGEDTDEPANDTTSAEQNTENPDDDLEQGSDNDPADTETDEFYAIISNDYVTVNERTFSNPNEVFLVFRADEGDFAGSYHTSRPAPTLPDEAAIQGHVVSSVIPEDPTVTNVEVLNNTCPDLEDFVCLAYQGNVTASGRSIGGIYIAERFSIGGTTGQDYLDTLNLYSIGRPFHEYTEAVDELISTYYGLPSMYFGAGSPPPDAQ